MDPEGRLAQALAREPLSAAWLFGSRVGGQHGPLSDVDIGILPRRGLDADERHALRGRVADAAERAYGVPHADVLFVDEAAPHLAFAAISGRIILNADNEHRWMTEARVMTEHHDRRHADERWLATTRERYARGEFA